MNVNILKMLLLLILQQKAHKLGSLDEVPRCLGFIFHHHFLLLLLLKLNTMSKEECSYNEKMQIFQSATFSKMCGKFGTNSVTSVTILLLKRTYNKLNHCSTAVTCQPNQNVFFSLEIDYLSFKIALLPFYPFLSKKNSV